MFIECMSTKRIDSNYKTAARNCKIPKGNSEKHYYSILFKFQHNFKGALYNFQSHCSC